MHTQISTEHKFWKDTWKSIGDAYFWELRIEYSGFEETIFTVYLLYYLRKHFFLPRLSIYLVI